MNCHFLACYAFVVVSAIASLAADAATSLPPPAQRQQMVQALSDQMLRLDGDGLLARVNRSETWDATMARLSQEAATANTLFDLGRAFRRVDATYPNLHAYVTLAADLDEVQANGMVVLPLQFGPASIGSGNVSSDFRIGQVEPSFASSGIQSGDQLVAINGQNMTDWLNQGQLFCKFPMAQQCALEFYDNFTAELLGWNRHLPLRLTLKRGDRTWDVDVPVSLEPAPTNDPYVSCEKMAPRYPGFKLAFNGYNLCGFTSSANPGVVVLRIASFEYPQNMSLASEVAKFWISFWQAQAPKTKTLIVDVINNYGGDAPIPYYALLFPSSFQEEYVEFKKIEEFDQPDILSGLFWGEKGKEVWLSDIQHDGTYAAVPVGGFLPPVPQFCADEKEDCRKGLFPAKDNRFSGRIEVLANHWCVSSCVGFVYNLAAVLGHDRVHVFGEPDSGDSAYGRLAVLLAPNGTSVASEVVSEDASGGTAVPNPWISQVVTVTKSTDAKGNLLSAHPTDVDEWVPRASSQSDDQWSLKVFQSALNAAGNWGT